MIALRDEDIDRIRHNGEIEEREKNQMLRAKKMKSIAEVLEDVEVVIDMHFFVEFSQTKSSTFLKKTIDNQRWIDMALLKKTWRTMNCTPKS